MGEHKQRVIAACLSSVRVRRKGEKTSLLSIILICLVKPLSLLTSSLRRDGCACCTEGVLDSQDSRGEAIHGENNVVYVVENPRNCYY